MNVSVKIDVKKSNPDDFYLQWPEIFWWQMKFNLELQFKNLAKNNGNVKLKDEHLAWKRVDVE